MATQLRGTPICSLTTRIQPPAQLPHTMPQTTAGSPGSILAPTSPKNQGGTATGAEAPAPSQAGGQAGAGKGMEIGAACSTTGIHAMTGHTEEPRDGTNPMTHTTRTATTRAGTPSRTGNSETESMSETGSVTETGSMRGPGSETGDREPAAEATTGHAAAGTRGP